MLRAQLLSPDRSGRAFVLAAALFLALLVRMVVPSGFMPVVGADQTVRIEMCTGRGPISVLAPAAQREGEPSAPTRGQDLCRFALNAQAGDLPSPAAAPPTTFAQVELASPRFRSQARHAQGLSAPPPPARAPPAHSY